MTSNVAPSVAWPALDLARLRAPLAVAAMTALHVFLAANHALGRDELQAWLIATNSRDLSSLLWNLRNEGHPPLFHMLLLAVHLVTGSKELWLLSATAVMLAVATATLILYRSPFPFWVRIALCLNGLLLFEYGVLARSYALGTLLVVAVCSFRAHPAAWLLLAAMPHVSIHFGLLAGVMALLRVIDDERTCRGLIGLAMVTVSGALSLWLMWPAPDTVPAVVRTDLAGSLITTFTNLGSLLLPVSPFGGYGFWDGRGWIPLNMVAALGVLTVLPLLLAHTHAAHRLWWLLLAAMALLSVGVFLCFARHFGVLFLLVLAVAWRDWGLPTFHKRLFAGLSAWLAGMGVVLAGASATIPFTQSDKAAAWIVRNGLADKPWTSWPPAMMIEYTARLDKPMIDLTKGCTAMFPQWTYSDMPEVQDARFGDLMRQRVAQAGGSLYLALSHDAAMPEIAGLQMQPLYRVDGGAYAQAQTLLRLQSRQVDVSKAVGFPRC